MNFNIPVNNHVRYNLDTEDGSYIHFIDSKNPIWHELPILPHSYGYFIAGPRHFTERHHYAHLFQLFYTISGTGRFIVNGKTHLTTAGTVVLLDCSTDNRYESFEGTWTHEWIHISGHPCEMFYQLLNPNGFSVYTIPDQTQFETMLHEIRDLFPIQNTLGLVHTSTRILQLLDYLYEIVCQQNNSQPQNSRERVLQALRYIDQHYNENLTLESLAGTVFLSKFYFARLFQTYCGMTPNDYLANVRVKRAKFLLLSSNLSINEIGYQVGLSGGNSFARLFRQITGVSPSHYRKHVSTVEEEVPYLSLAKNTLVQPQESSESKTNSPV